VGRREVQSMLTIPVSKWIAKKGTEQTKNVGNGGKYRGHGFRDECNTNWGT